MLCAVTQSRHRLRLASSSDRWVVSSSWSITNAPSCRHRAFWWDVRATDTCGFANDLTLSCKSACRNLHAQRAQKTAGVSNLEVDPIQMACDQGVWTKHATELPYRVLHRHLQGLFQATAHFLSQWVSTLYLQRLGQRMCYLGHGLTAVSELWYKYMTSWLSLLEQWLDSILASMSFLGTLFTVHTGVSRRPSTSLVLVILTCT